MRNKKRISKALIGIILLNLLLMINPFITYASKTKSVSFSSSMSRTRSQTITIPNLKSVDSISVNTGNVSYSINGDKVTINVSNGTATSSSYNSSKYSKSVTGYRTSSNNSFSSTYSYSDGSGYSGTLTKSGSSYLAGGSYTPSHTKYVTVTRSGYVTISETNHPLGIGYLVGGAMPPSSIPYSSGGYVGSLTQIENIDRTPPSGTDIATTFYWTIIFGGNVTRSASDTRFYRQNYSGTAYKGGTDYYYSYNVTMQYTDNRTPHISIDTISNNTRLSGNPGFNEISINNGTVKDEDIGDIVAIKYTILDSSNNPIPGHEDVTIQSSITANGSNQSFKDYTITIDNSIPEGDYTLKIIAEDDKGGTGEVSRTFTVDKSGPVITTNKKMVVPLGAYINIDITATDSSNPSNDVSIDYIFSHASFSGSGVHTVNTGKVYIHPNTDVSMVEGEIINIDITAKDSLDNISTDTVKVKIDSTGVTLPSSL